jgi:hypothetical protein
MWAIDEVSRQLHALAAFNHGKEPPHWIKDWVSRRAGLCGVENNLSPVGNRNPATQVVNRLDTDRAILAPNTLRKVFKINSNLKQA